MRLAMQAIRLSLHGKVIEKDGNGAEAAADAVLKTLARKDVETQVEAEVTLASDVLVRGSFVLQQHRDRPRLRRCLALQQMDRFVTRSSPDPERARCRKNVEALLGPGLHLPFA